MPYAYGPRSYARRSPVAQMADIILAGAIALMVAYVVMVALFVTR